ncbi:uncharacterized protein LOC105637258 [Jatropha curcas]|uniref:uncharacterized protein LOC105637258 n=1 Tax=Jatropha curcas TaxID=180498 RepID=UPI001893CBE1|nr:uncharacterized protein LOC105637258 [Jatropha curcas]
MQSDSSSDDSNTATSSLTPKYVCKRCSKEYENGHALAGHYNAHRYRSFPSINLLTVNMAMVTNFHQNPPPPPSPAVVAEQAVVQTTQFNGSPHGVLKLKARGSPRYHPYLVKKNNGADSSNSQKTISDPLSNVSKKDADGVVGCGDEDGDGVEAKSSKKEELDLELRLGFYKVDGKKRF